MGRKTHLLDGPSHFPTFIKEIFKCSFIWEGLLFPICSSIGNEQRLPRTYSKKASVISTTIRAFSFSIVTIDLLKFS
jgi:hypothetical protein